MRGMIIFYQSGVKASVEKFGRSEQIKNITQGEEPLQTREEKCSENIIAESEKNSSVE